MLCEVRHAETAEVAHARLADDLDSVRTQTVRLIIANATDLARRRAVYERFRDEDRETFGAAR